MLRDKDKPMIAKVLFVLSLSTTVLAFIGAAGYDLYLASTQWLIVGTLLAAWGIFLYLEAEFRS